VESVAWLQDVVYILCTRSSTILRFSTSTRQRLADIDIDGLVSPHHIVACDTTSQLFIADFECVWRFSADGAVVQRWVTLAAPWTLSVTRGRLLMTVPHGSRLVQFDVGGNELMRFSLKGEVEPRHAVALRTGTFVVSCTVRGSHSAVGEVTDKGEVVQWFRSSSLRWPDLLDVDARGNVLVSDTYNSRILLLSARLALVRVLIDERQLNGKPLRGFCFVEQTGQLLVALQDGVVEFKLLSS